MTDLDRRDMLKIMSVGVVTAGAASTLGRSAMATEAEGVTPEQPAEAANQKAEPEGERPWWLIAPFVADGRVAGARLLSMSPIRRGVVTLELEGDDRARFDVHICKRDETLDLPPPARSRHYDFLLANGGKGDRTTSRAEGEVVIALARAAYKNETEHDVLPLVTMRQRWANMRVPC